MTLAPVASLVAQINQLQDISIQSNAEDNAVSNSEQASKQDSQHHCCEDKCQCSFQNECDIQHLSFFALKPQNAVLVPPENSITIALHSRVTEKYSHDKLYRPPITNL